MASLGGEARCEETLALAGIDAVVDPTTSHPASTISLAHGVEGGRMEAAADGRGQAEDVAEILVAESGQQDDGNSPPRLPNSSGSSGHGDGIPGGRSHHVRFEDAEEETPIETARSPDRRNPSSPTRAQWPARRSCSRASGTSRRTTADEGRTGEIGPAVQCGDQGHRHERADQGEDQADGGPDHQQEEGDGILSSITEPNEALYTWVDPRTQDRRPRSSESSLHTTSSSSFSRRFGSLGNDSGTGGTADVHGADGGLGDDPGVLPDARRDGSTAVRQSVGTMNEASFRKLRRGVKQLIKDAMVRARRLRRRIGAPQSYVKEVLETQYMDFLDGLAAGEMAENFVTDMILPDVIDKKGFRQDLQTPQMKPKLPKTKKPIPQDEWRFGHVNGWICRDHYLPRRVQFFPVAVTAPRFFPTAAFTGRRRTVIFDADGNIAEDIADNYIEDQTVARDEPWIGETWLEVHPEWIAHHYPKQTIQQFRGEIQDILFNQTGSQGVYTLSNGDKLFVGRQTMKMTGTLPSEQTVAVSSFIYTHEDGWMMLEDKVRHQDRAHLRPETCLFGKSGAHLPPDPLRIFAL